MVDIGDLMKLIMAKEGVREVEGVDGKLAHELADCFWVIMVLAYKYDINLEQSFLRVMDKLEEKINLDESN